MRGVCFAGEQQKAVEAVIDTSLSRILGIISRQPTCVCVCVCVTKEALSPASENAFKVLRIGCAGAKKKKGNLQYPFQAVIKLRHIKAVLVANRKSKPCQFSRAFRFSL